LFARKLFTSIILAKRCLFEFVEGKEGGKEETRGDSFSRKWELIVGGNSLHLHEVYTIPSVRFASLKLQITSTGLT